MWAYSRHFCEMLWWKRFFTEWVKRFLSIAPEEQFDCMNAISTSPMAYTGD